MPTQREIRQRVQPEEEMSQIELSKPMITLIAVVAVIVVGLVIMFIAGASKDDEITKDVQAEVSQEELQSIIAKVGELIILPEGQEPMVATVQDAEKLALEKPFFIGSQNGDRVLLYQDKAIIYRPEEHKLINVGPVYVQTNTEEQEINKVSIDVRNGTSVSGAAQNIADQLVATGVFTTTGVSGAAHTNYVQTIIVNPKDIPLNNLAEELNAVIVQELPENEKATKADLVIIFGIE